MDTREEETLARKVASSLRRIPVALEGCVRASLPSVRSEWSNPRNDCTRRKEPGQRSTAAATTERRDAYIGESHFGKDLRKTALALSIRIVPSRRGASAVNHAEGERRGEEPKRRASKKLKETRTEVRCEGEEPRPICPADEL